MIGTADIFKSVVAAWNQYGLHTLFSAEWKSGTRSSEFLSLSSEEAEGSQPFPYCVLELMPAKTMQRMTSSSAGTNRENRKLSAMFRIYARETTGGNESAKMMAARLYEEVSKIFGGHPTQKAKLDGWSMDHGHVILCQYVNDYPVKKDIQIYSWIGQYLITTDVPIAI